MSYGKKSSNELSFRKDKHAHFLNQKNINCNNRTTFFCHTGFLMTKLKDNIGAIAK